ncbi:hypothetical protein PBI_DEWDROP_31 [Microbacterium phage Dewdrop]|nr:hypothetical protein PBI_LEAF_31 [Microbacterium phage Leaf]QGZ17400.1 hypothetical protein PBI_DEWDROP_31 [Microbacterium phage Dewdrop]
MKTTSSEPEVWDDARIREAFIYDGGESEYHDPEHGAQTQRQVAGEIFDRWLKARDERMRLTAEPSDETVGAAMNAVVTYYEEQGHTVRPESIDYQAMRAGLRAAAGASDG